MNALELGEKLDQYELFDVVSQNSSATIFRAWDTENSRMVALKVPRLPHDREVLLQERLLHEERITADLHHPAIMKVLGPFERSRGYLVMECIGGKLLSDLLRREGRLSTTTAVDLTVQIANALVYLHEHGIIHRNLRSDNVMILPENRVKLIDVSIALGAGMSDIPRTSTFHQRGAPDYYMAPEQVKGRRGDARTDIYSLGVILHEMLTGVVPFWDKNVYLAMEAKMQSSPPPPSLLLPEISPLLEEIILHA